MTSPLRIPHHSPSSSTASSNSPTSPTSFSPLAQQLYTTAQQASRRRPSVGSISSMSSVGSGTGASNWPDVFPQHRRSSSFAGEVILPPASENCNGVCNHHHHRRPSVAINFKPGFQAMARAPTPVSERILKGEVWYD